MVIEKLFAGLRFWLAAPATKVTVNVTVIMYIALQRPRHITERALVNRYGIHILFLSLLSNNRYGI